MDRTRSFGAAVIVVGHLTLSLEPCPPAARSAEPAVMQRAPAMMAGSEHSHHGHGIVDATGQEAGSQHADHGVSLGASSSSTSDVVLTALCPCGCSERSLTGRASLSVGDFVPPDVAAYTASGAQAVLRVPLLRPPASPVYRVFHVPTSV